MNVLVLRSYTSIERNTNAFKLAYVSVCSVTFPSVILREQVSLRFRLQFNPNLRNVQSIQKNKKWAKIKLKIPIWWISIPS